MRASTGSSTRASEPEGEPVPHDEQEMSTERPSSKTRRSMDQRLLLTGHSSRYPARFSTRRLLEPPNITLAVAVVQGYTKRITMAGKGPRSTVNSRSKWNAEAGSTGTIGVRSKSPERRARAWLVATLLLASVGWLASSSARAGCSHLVTANTDVARFRLAHLDRLLLAGAASKDATRSLPLDRPAPPCSGFRCSGNSIPATPMSIPRGTVRSDAWNRVDFGMLAPWAGSSSFSFHDHTPCPVDRVERLTRPPR